MNNLLAESRVLFEEVLNDNQRKDIKELIYKAQECKVKEFLEAFWAYDQSIGGIGGYSMPSNPIYNPFPGGEYRELFRPLQYARSDMEHDLYYYNHHRNIVLMSGMHLEGVVRILLKTKRFFGTVKFSNATLGKATKEIQKMNVLSPKVISGLYAFVKLYNQSKHDVNHNEERVKLFHLSDAIVSYLTARIIGIEILSAINHDSLNKKYEIDNNRYGFKPIK